MADAAPDVTSVIHPEPQVRAAGGIIVRPAKKGPKVLLVHRQRYDDWSFPKGKLDPGESFKQAALREVKEETGLVCELHRPRLPKLTYVDGDGLNKEVRYWLMTVLSGSFVPNDEVDLIAWVRLRHAEHRLTYARDRQLLHDLRHSGRVERLLVQGV